MSRRQRRCWPFQAVQFDEQVTYVLLVGTSAGHAQTRAPLRAYAELTKQFAGNQRERRAGIDECIDGHSFA